MKLLILTQSVDLDNPILGSFHRWLIEFAKNCENVIVICLEKGRHELPANVRVLSLGKERGSTKSERVRNFYRYIRQERNNYDTVFVHMNPIYLVLGGLLWKIWGKRSYLWYSHRNVDAKLRVAKMFVNNIFTASMGSFRMRSSKVVAVGHGIDIERYSEEPRTKIIGTEPIRILHVGRITPIKNCETLVEAANILNKQWNKDFEVQFIGGPVSGSDALYLAKLREKVMSLGLEEKIRFIGNVTQQDLPSYYAAADVTVNMTPTGGVDKSVLESMAAKVPVILSSKLPEFTETFGQAWPEVLFEEKDSPGLANNIMKLFDQGKAVAAGEAQHDFVLGFADVRVLIKKIVNVMNSK